MEIVINACYGGFSVSKAVYDELGLKWDGYGYIDGETLGLKDKFGDSYRTNKQLINAIKKVGLKKASGKFASLKIIEIPNNIEWEIDEYDGIETVHEKHDVWS
ncbi:MAG: hypothetical protein WC516_06250 [Patescibacteria group bacterium]|jgi:hypothetical protein